MEIHSVELKGSTRKLLDNKKIIHISLLWRTNKVQRFLFQKTKWRKPNIIMKFSLFWKAVLLKISIWLFSFVNAKACIIYLTAIIKMCSISCFVLKNFRAIKTFIHRVANVPNEHANMPYGVPMVQLDVPTCQTACQFFNLAYQCAKRCTDFSNIS